MAVRVKAMAQTAEHTPVPSTFELDDTKQTLAFELTPLLGASTFRVYLFAEDPDPVSEAVTRQCMESECT